MFQTTERMIPGISLDKIEPANVISGIPTFFHSRGFEWDLYSINAPMAWEITKGSRKVFIGNVDYKFSHTPVSNSDVVYTADDPAHGNWTIFNTLSSVDDGGLAESTYPYSGLHGSHVLATSIAKGNNDPLTSVSAGQSIPSKIIFIIQHTILVLMAECIGKIFHYLDLPHNILLFQKMIAYIFYFQIKMVMELFISLMIKD